MEHTYLLKFKYNLNDINNKLIPWDQVIIQDSIKIEYQVGIGIKCKKHYIQFTTPFFIHIPYATCSIWNIESNTNIELKLLKFCYFTRLATYILNDKSSTNIKKLNSYHISNKDLKLNTILNDKHQIQLIDNTTIDISDTKVIFKNLNEDNIYPFIWLESSLNPNTNFEGLIPGSPVYQQKTNRMIGIIHSHDEHIINIIPMISIQNIINNYEYHNIFFSYEINSEYAQSQTQSLTHQQPQSQSQSQAQIHKQPQTRTKKNRLGPIIIKEIFSKKTQFEINDQILSLNNKQISTDGYILSNKLNIDVPIHTYIYYELIICHMFEIKRNNEYLQIMTDCQLLCNSISFKIKTQTEYYIIDNMIFCMPNLLMTEWLINNQIIIRNNLYLEYKLCPFKQIKKSYLFIGLIDIENHPVTIQNQLKSYNIRDHIEIFTVLSINNSESSNIKKYNSINKLTICDSNHNKLVLNWIET
jgi:hypothetical protein